MEKTIEKVTIDTRTWTTILLCVFIIIAILVFLKWNIYYALIPSAICIYILGISPLKCELYGKTAKKVDEMKTWKIDGEKKKFVRSVAMSYIR